MRRGLATLGTESAEPLIRNHPGQQTGKERQQERERQRLDEGLEQFKQLIHLTRVRTYTMNLHINAVGKVT